MSHAGHPSGPAHDEGQAGEGYGAECVIELASGGTIRTDSFEANPGGSSYVRVCEPGGRETGYWTWDEWKEDPQFVMGAILGAAKA
jgi:hypothetical protein